MALHQFLLDNGYIHPKSEHTKPAGIWRKLETLYNLEALDEREDARQLDKVDIPAAFLVKHAESDEDLSSSVDDDTDVYSHAANKIDNEDFALPDEAFGQEKWERRLETGKPRRGSSPMLLSELNLANEPPVRFTPSFSIEPSEAATPTAKRGRPRAGTTGRGRGAHGGSSTARRSTRKTESIDDNAENKIEDSDEEEGEEDEEAGDSEEEDDGEDVESGQSTPAPKSTRSTRGARGRPPARTPGRGRGRGK